MRTPAWISCAFVLLGVSTMSAQGADLAVQWYAKRYTVPTDGQIAQARAEFLALREPLEYEWVVERPAQGPWSVDDGASKVVLEGDMRELADTHGLAVLVYALWPYLRDPDYEARAFLVLESMVNAVDRGFPFGYRSRAEPGDWASWRKICMAGYEEYCAKALGEPGSDWYPHTVLFDPGVVVADRKDPAKRAAHVEAMRAALRDPALRTENPLEVQSIMGLLSQLDAAEAAPEIAGYLFYSWKQGGPYRASMERLRAGVENLADKVITSISRECPAHGSLSRSIGNGTLPLFLGKYAATSAEDRLVADGGGCAPLFALQYFVSLRLTRAESVAAIDAHLQANPGLPTEQAAALTELRMIVQSCQYQTVRWLFDLVPGGWDPVSPP